MPGGPAIDGFDDKGPRLPHQAVPEDRKQTFRNKGSIPKREQ